MKLFVLLRSSVQHLAHYYLYIFSCYWQGFQRLISGHFSKDKNELRFITSLWKNKDHLLCCQLKSLFVGLARVCSLSPRTDVLLKLLDYWGTQFSGVGGSLNWHWFPQPTAWLGIGSFEAMLESGKETKENWFYLVESAKRILYPHTGF